MNSHRLSEDLAKFIANTKEEHFRLQDFVHVAGDRGFGLVLLLLSLPSALPIPGTGISTPLGIAMFFVGLQMLSGREELWLPKFVRELKISKKTGSKMIESLNWILRKLEHLLRPRMSWLSSRPGHIWVGSMVMALSLVMQVPIPLTNTLPAAVIFVLALCQTEDDGFWGLLSSVGGMIVILGYIAGMIAIVFFGVQSFEEIKNYFLT